MKTQSFNRSEEILPSTTGYCTVWLYNAISPFIGIYEKGKWKIFYSNGFREIENRHHVIFWAYNPQIDIKQLRELKYFQ